MSKLTLVDPHKMRYGSTAPTERDVAIFTKTKQHFKDVDNCWDDKKELKRIRKEYIEWIRNMDCSQDEINNARRQLQTGRN